MPKSQENVRKTDDFLVISGKCQEFFMVCLVGIFYILYFSGPCEKKKKRVECKIKGQNILHTLIMRISQCQIGFAY